MICLPINPDLIRRVLLKLKVKATSVDDILILLKLLFKILLIIHNCFKHQPNTDVHVDSRLIVEYPDF